MKEFLEKVWNWCKETYSKMKQASKEKKSGWKFVTCVALMLVAVLVGSMVQTAGWKYEVTDLRNATNSGKITLKASDKAAPAQYTVSGKVASGLLYTPKNVKEGVLYPAVVFTHGLYNNREMQEQNSIEAVRRGYVALTIDCKAHGHNSGGTSSYGGFDGTNLLDAAKYLYNLPYVDKTKIAVSGHSMGGGETSNACAYDGIDTTKKPSGATWVVGDDACFKAGYHMGIISAAVVQANNLTSSNFGSNLLGAAGIKASSDEFFYSSTVKEAVYQEVARDTVTETNFTSYYVKKGGEYVKVAEDAKFVKGKTYYKLVAAGGSANSTFYLQSRQAVLFTKQAANNNEAAAMEKWETINGGIYADGKLVQQPVKNKRVSAQLKGAAVAQRNTDGTVKTSIRAVYEARETHPMNHFSTTSCGSIMDFLYCCFGVSPAAKYLNVNNQTWLTKEVFAIFGFFGIFGLLICLTELFLSTKTFGVLKAEEDVCALAPELKGVRKHVSYWLAPVLTTIFGAWSLANLTAGENILGHLGFIFGNVMKDSAYVLSNIRSIAIWGIICALFSLTITALIWVVNHIINIVVYKEQAAEHDEHPFAGFRIRGFEHALKTIVLGFLLVGIFYFVVFFIWEISAVDFRFWTFDLRVFNLDRITVYLAYAKWFFIYYLVTAALSNGYRVKNLPEWATLLINIVFNVLGITILMWAQNSHFIATGAMLQSANNLWYIACYPIIPCVIFATWISRSLYKKTGNAWLAGIVSALIMTTIACANTSVDGAITKVAEWWLI